ncbi:MAG: hypothetical protein HY098_01895 [Nitrospinae bacterium]|nr:hypothetical protein [Nitrospinota bacterium]
MVSIEKVRGARNYVGRGRTGTVAGFLSALLFLGLVLAGTAAADDYHYVNNIIGERAAGMGGAYVAVADDTSGLFYNPAGTVFATGNSVSASGNTWRQESKTYNGALGNSNYQRNSTTIQPNFFGVVQHTPIGTIGFSYVIPDSTLQQQDQSFAYPYTNIPTYTLNYNNEINSYNIGPSYATDVTKNLKVGITLYYHFKKRKTINNQIQTVAVTGQPNQAQWDNFLFKDEENGARPILGFIYAPEDGKYSLGLAVSKTFVFNASQYFQKTCRHSLPAGTGDPCYSATDSAHQPVEFPIQTGDVLPDYPTEVRFGAAFFPSNAWLISADVDYFSRANSDSFGVYGWTRQPVLNLAVGTEYYFTPAFAVRGGLYTDNTNVDSQGLAVADDKINLYGASLSTAWFTKYSSISLGLNYAFGSGDSNISASGVLGTMSSRVLTIFLGSSYNY